MIEGLSNRNLLNQAYVSPDERLIDLTSQLKSTQLRQAEEQFNPTRLNGSMITDQKVLTDLNLKEKNLKDQILKIMKEINSENTLTLTTAGDIFQANLDSIEEETSFLKDKFRVQRGLFYGKGTFEFG